MTSLYLALMFLACEQSSEKAAPKIQKHKKTKTIHKHVPQQPKKLLRVAMKNKAMFKHPR